MQRNLLTLSILLLLSQLLFGCGKPPSAADYQAEATALCEVFNPAKWQNTGNMTPVEIQTKLSEAMQAAARSDKMKAVMETVAKVPADTRYEYLVERIEALTDTTYSCPAMQEYLGS